MQYKRSDSPVFSDTPTVRFLSSDGEVSSSDKESRKSSDRGTSSGKSAPSSNEEDGFSSDDNLPLSNLVSAAKAQSEKDSDSDNSESTSDASTIILPSRAPPSEPDESNMEVDNPIKKRKVGRPKGRTKPPRRDFSRPTSILHKNVCRDMVDEECERLGIYYKRWTPLNPEQTSHPSVRELDDDTVVPEEQEIPKWCIMCPRNKYLKNGTIGMSHYLSRHHKTLLVVDVSKILACKCSEMRSHGSDNSARNKHYHCHLCYHPFKSGDLLATHFVSEHPELEPGNFRHLMKEANPHRRHF